MSTRQAVKRKPIVLDTFVPTELPTNAIESHNKQENIKLRMPSSQTIPINNLKKVPELKPNLMNHVKNSSNSLDVTSLEVHGIPQQSSRKATISSIDDEFHDTSSLESPKRQGFMNTIKAKGRVRELNRKMSIYDPKNETKSYRHEVASALLEKKTDSDEYFRMRDELQKKENELRRLREKISILENGNAVKNETNYKVACSILKELIKVQTGQIPMEESDLINDFLSSIPNHSRDHCENNLDTEAEYKQIIKELFFVLRQAIQKNLLLNDHLNQLGLGLPNTIIQKNALSQLVAKYENLFNSEEDEPTIELPIENIEESIKKQLESIECEKWDREATNREIISEYTVISIHVE
eukprot:NODE_203_length_12996_cov_1.033961.p5 type:complete len:354 gc:universal NODE_203_length_12996_cov_1.033961:9934-10995(+)